MRARQNCAHGKELRARAAHLREEAHRELGRDLGLDALAAGHGAGRAVAQGAWDGAHFHPDAAAFAEVEGESIDYAVMENTGRAALVPVAMGWSDIGSWSALRDARRAGGDARDGGPDRQGNVARGPAELVDCRNVMVDSDGPRVSCIGLDDVIVVVDGDEVLVTSADGAQRVGKLDGARRQ